MHRLYVYSSTGNSLALAEGLGRRLGACELINMARHPEKEERVSGETVGLVFPVHAFGLPSVVRRFMERLSTDGASVYLLLNSAGMPLGASALAETVLRRRGLSVRAAFHVTMAGNYPPLSNPPSGRKRQNLADRGERALDAVAEAVREGREVSPPGRALRALSEFINGKAFERVSGEDRRFFADENCVGCGLCAELCPVGNIVLEGKRPRWLHRCVGCFACFHWCPQKALQYNRSSSAGRNRYNHPAVSLDRYRRWCRE